ncbi:LpqB family beta-propeller domain-containing protein [Allonocardiopsis opalescens]|uniref:Sporulation and spore germination protein n=1 Tax=Allonocardiopsis opalescens TaxID=1144618 RepID=A0A2T0QC93_9ACTN|nr:LpqB family beta-propeller domain-containing protein [Allonocardiopsis opalescens]PRY01518.1 sporulation and spore germination protein [Allonocardiopsis opalescens]
MSDTPAARPPRRRRSPLGAALTAIAAAVALSSLSACAMVPTGGPVMQGSGGAGSADGADPYIGLLPPPPAADANERELVTGFLTALGSLENDYGAARDYLTPDAQQTWQPSSSIVVYENHELVATLPEEGGRASVTLRADEVATIQPGGQYVAAEPGSRVEETFRLERVDGQWRIAELPERLLLNRSSSSRAYRPMQLYYFSPDMERLVPDPVFLPIHSRSDLAFQLVAALVRGGTEWLSPAVRTAFPEGTELLGVSADGGEFTVDLSAEVAQASADARRAMSAQLLWTLSGLPEVQSVRLLTAGNPVEVPGMDEDGVQTVDMWAEYDPDAVGENAHAYLAQSTGLAQLDSRPPFALSQVAGPAGDGSAPLARPAVSLDGQWAAGLSPGGDQVQLIRLRQDAQVETVLTDGDFVALSWDPYGGLWVVERRGTAEEPTSVVWLLRDGTDPVQVSVPELADQEILQWRVSRDGARAAAVVAREGEDGTGVLLGRIVHTGEEAGAEAFVPLATQLSEVTDLAWRDAGTLALIGRLEGRSLQAYEVPVHGTELISASAPSGVEMQSITATPGQPLLAGASDGWIWYTDDTLVWQHAAEGAYAAYPG